MIISFVRKFKVQNYNLPSKVDGSYWITDDFNKKISINIEAINGQWVLRTNNIEILSNSNAITDVVILKEYQFYFIKTEYEKDPLILYCSPDYDNTYGYYAVKQNCNITIGSNPSCQIIVNNELVSPEHARLIYTDGIWNIEDLNSKLGLFVNNDTVAKKRVYPGDIIFIMGLKIIIIGNFILINNPNNSVTHNHDALTSFNLKPLAFDDKELNEEDIKLYKEEDYFLRSPRLRASIEKANVTIDPPPEREKQQEMPLILTLGPMLSMGMTSMVTSVVALSNIANGKANLSASIPTLILSGAMLMTMILWPLLSKAYEKAQKRKREKIRQNKYTEYINSKKKEIQEIIGLQKQVLLTNNITLDECKDVILNRKENLWERKISENDFLNIRIGIGNIDAEIKISYPEKHFSIDEDNLRKELDDLVNASNQIPDVPICIPLTKKYVTAVIGNDILANQFIDAMLLQMMTAHSYEDLKIIFFTNEKNASHWEYLKVLPHCWSDDNAMRFFAIDINEMQQISNHLEEVFNSRKYKNTSSELEENDKEYTSYSPYYLIITDDLKTARTTKIFKDIVSQKINYGFSLLIKNDKVSNLPNECSMFVDIGKTKSGIFENEITSKNQRFIRPDFITSINMLECTTKLANIPIELSINKIKLPNVISFLEMYDVGKIEQLNVLERWKQNNPVTSLKAPVGIDEAGELFDLNLHEKFHGPHGLIAGMTGSGKSEFIITYILSLAVNYHPDELTFVLIDYKGGGLAGAFENKETGIKLPHLAGTITNLDTVEMKRSLASIQSELKKRQRMFNKARELLNESTIDIYKYQRLYREGQVKTPISHLFIISDEFAELKTQQPEFMEQLISTARIGRSLGVHLILATQKPSGVVDDQIWSNSKFRVCLKVQDKNDSMDMIKCLDAATLKNIGRFYLQVGYNEFFALGQSAWCGMKYIPMDKRKKKIDTSINFVDNIGNIIKNVDNKKAKESDNEKGEELTNVVNYLNDIAKRENINVSKLWLDRIPDLIYIDDLKQKYSYMKEELVINPIIGEYDDPANQKQGLLTLNLAEDGNTVIYGTSGSGKEIMLNSIIYSVIMNHSVDEVNFYIMDFGAETLRSFVDAPHVGDVLLINDIEKISNLFKMLRNIIETRKKLFADFNGDYKFYCQKSGKKVPTIIVIINYYEAFAEIYSDYEDQLLQLTREGLKYGVIFIVSVVGTTTMRYKLLQNFKQQLVLQLNDQADYATILGNVNGTYPSKAKGRGIIKLDEVYEFQTAYPYDKEKMSDYIKIICKKLKQQAKKFASKIPILPEAVNEEFIKPFIKDLKSLPVGIEKENLEICTNDFKTKYVTLLTALETFTVNSFVTSLINEASMIKDTNIIVIDAEELLDKTILNNVNYYNKDFDQIFNNIRDTITSQYEIYKNNNFNKESLDQYKHTLCFIIGIDNFKGKLSPDISLQWDSTLEKGKDLNKVSFIVIDAVNTLKKFEYETWYKTCVNSSNGIWVGSGIAEQFTLKLSKTPKDSYDKMDNNFGYYVKNGNATMIKLLEFKNEPVTSDDSDVLE